MTRDRRKLLRDGTMALGGAVTVLVLSTAPGIEGGLTSRAPFIGLGLAATITGAAFFFIHFRGER